MLLRSGSRGMNVLALASRLIAEAGSLAGLIAWAEADFRRLKGIGHVKALQLVAVMEVARRVLGERQGEAPLLNRPGARVFLFPADCHRPGGGKALGPVPQPQEPADQMRRGHFGHGDGQPRASARSLPLRHPRGGHQPSSACTTTRAETRRRVRPISRSPAGCARRPEPSTSSSPTISSWARKPAIPPAAATTASAKRVCSRARSRPRGPAGSASGRGVPL